MSFTSVFLLGVFCATPMMFSSSAGHCLCTPKVSTGLLAHLLSVCVCVCKCKCSSLKLQYMEMLFFIYDLSISKCLLKYVLFHESLNDVNYIPYHSFPPKYLGKRNTQCLSKVQITYKTDGSTI